MKRGRRLKPTVKVLAFSGFRSGLPPFSTEHCPDGHCAIRLVEPPLPYWAAVTPVLEQAPALAVAGLAASPAQGSADTSLVLVMLCGRNRSITLGARIALCNEPRKVMSLTGAHWAPSFQVLAVAPIE